MTAGAEVQTSKLWALIEEWRAAMPYPPSQRKFAARLGVSPGVVSQWKLGQTTMPTPESLRAIAAELRVPYERVLDAALRDAGYRE